MEEPDTKEVKVRKEKEIQSSLINKFTKNVRFEVFTAVTMKNAILWDVVPCRSTRCHIPEDSILQVY
jgi:hypothetical protein